MLRILLILSISISSIQAVADETPLTYDRVRLSGTASSEVANDTLVAVLYAQREGQDAAPLAGEVNAAVSTAERICGTWVLQQVSSRNELDRLG